MHAHTMKYGLPNVKPFYQTIREIDLVLHLRAYVSDFSDLRLFFLSDCFGVLPAYCHQKSPLPLSCYSWNDVFFVISRYVWVRLPQHTQDAVFAEGLPFWTPALIGCAIAVNKTYFNLIGAFDEGQTIWGGENLELSFRNWLCGGTVVTIPCSRVGHVFRPLPYREESDWQKAWQKNLMRVADVWLGNYRRYFYSSTRIYEGRRVDYTPEERVTLQERIDLRDRLKCKPFKWYVNFVIPEIEIPPHDALFHGEITGYRSQACWEVLDDDYIGITYGCYEHKLIPENMFSLTKDGFLTHRDRCARFLYPKPILKLERCPSKPDLKFGIWSIQFRQQMRWAQLKIEMDAGGGKGTWCMMQVTNAVDPHKRMQMPQAASCDVDNLFQFWSFSYRFDYRDEFIDKLKDRWRMGKSRWVRSRNCGCLVTWFCYQLIAKPGNKAAAVSWPDPDDNTECFMCPSHNYFQIITILHALISLTTILNFVSISLPFTLNGCWLTIHHHVFYHFLHIHFMQLGADTTDCV